MPFDNIQTTNLDNLDAEQLRKAWHLIGNPRLWLQGAFTRELPDGRLAQCTYSALFQAVTGRPFKLKHMLASTHDDNLRVQALARLLLAAAPPRRRSDDVEADLCSMNNTTTHPALMNTFARAIATAEAQNLPV